MINTHSMIVIIFIFYSRFLHSSECQKLSQKEFQINKHDRIAYSCNKNSALVDVQFPSLEGVISKQDIYSLLTWGDNCDRNFQFDEFNHLIQQEKALNLCQGKCQENNFYANNLNTKGNKIYLVIFCQNKAWKCTGKINLEWKENFQIEESKKEILVGNNSINGINMHGLLIGDSEVNCDIILMMSCKTHSGNEIDCNCESLKKNGDSSAILSLKINKLIETSESGYFYLKIKLKLNGKTYDSDYSIVANILGEINKLYLGIIIFEIIFGIYFFYKSKSKYEISLAEVNYLENEETILKNQKHENE